MRRVIISHTDAVRTALVAITTSTLSKRRCPSDVPSVAGALAPAELVAAVAAGVPSVQARTSSGGPGIHAVVSDDDGVDLAKEEMGLRLVQALCLVASITRASLGRIVDMLRGVLG